MTWITLDSKAAVDDLLTAFVGFHDACLREVSIASETYVDERGAMSCPRHLDTSALLFFQSQGAKHHAIEILCKAVSFFQLSPTPEGHDSILTGASGPPNTSINIVRDPSTSADIEIHAAMVWWRPVEGVLGPRLRYRSESLGRG